MLIKLKNGPPTGKPVNIEIAGEDLIQLAATADRFKRYVDSLQIGGIEELKSDFATTKPEIIITSIVNGPILRALLQQLLVMLSGQASWGKRYQNSGKEKNNTP